MKIYPSILETDKDQFLKHLSSYLPIFNHMQIDIVDGDFADTATLSVQDVLELITEHLSTLSEPADKLPTLEFHLMVNMPQSHVEELSRYNGPLSITNVLIRGRTLVQSALTSQSETLPFHLSSFLNPEDGVDLYWHNSEAVQIMTIEPGGQGRPFMPEMLEKIDQLRLSGFTGDIILDGAINAQTLPIIARRTHLPTAVCPGSYFHEDPAEKLKILQQIIDTSSVNRPM